MSKEKYIYKNEDALKTEISIMLCGIFGLDHIMDNTAFKELSDWVYLMATTTELKEAS